MKNLLILSLSSNVMDDSKDKSDFQLCLEEFRKSGVKPTIYPIDQERITKIKLKVQEKINQIKIIARKQDCAIGIVGGFVRDLLLDKPSEDVDFVVFKGNINKLTESIAQKLNGKIGKMSNKTFTTQIRFPDHLVFEFNSTRKERYEYPSRVPIVEAATIVEDLQRRDFTINAFLMFDDKYLDIFEGTQDLHNRLIRTTRNPDEVFREDYLRMFRAIRFACRLNFEISNETKKGIKLHVRNILDVPSERILIELKQSFEYNPLMAFDLMVNLNIFETMFPQIINSKLDLNQFQVKTTFDKIREEMKFLKSKNIAEIYPYLALFLKEIKIESKFNDTENSLLVENKKTEAIRQILVNYKFSNKEKDTILNYIHFTEILAKNSEQNMSDFKIRKFIRATYPKTENIFLIVEALQSIKNLKINYEKLEKRFANIGANKDLIFFEPALNGLEIADILKIEGEEVGEAKKSLYDAIMSEEIKNSKKECLLYLQKKYNR